jgi:hypothetical protein
MIEQEEFFVDESGSYLTLARYMREGWNEYEQKQVWGEGYTGFTELAIQDAYKSGFMAGFEARFFKQTD